MTEADWNNCTDPTPMLQFLRITGKASERKLRLFAVACCRRVWHLLQKPGEEDIRRAVDAIERVADGNTTPKSLAAHQQKLLLHPIAGCPAGYDLSHAAHPFWAPLAALEFAVLAVTHGISGPAETPNVARFAAFAEAARWFSERGPTYASAHLADHVDRLGREAEATFLAGFRQVAVADRANGYAVLVALDDVRKAQAACLRCIVGPLPLRRLAVERRWLTWNDAAVQRLALVIYNDGRFEDLPILADALEEGGCTDNDILAHCRGSGPHVKGCWVVDLLLQRD